MRIAPGVLSHLDIKVGCAMQHNLFVEKGLIRNLRSLRLLSRAPDHVWLFKLHIRLQISGVILCITVDLLSQCP